MNLAYYTVLFDCATDVLFETIGIGRDYKLATNHGTFVAETHNLYEREVLVGEQLRIASQIVGADSKRLHLAHEMFRIAGADRVATQELMFLWIDLNTRRVAPFLAAAQQRVAAAAAAHTHLPRPHWLGRHIALQP